MKIAPVMTIPELAHDAMMLKRFGTKVDARGKFERRIVYNLMLHLEANGFAIRRVFDGEGDVDATTALDAMELIFDLDEASLKVASTNPAFDQANEHGIWIVLGNGVDCIADWNYFEDDRDGFNAIMDEFDAEDFE